MDQAGIGATPAPESLRDKDLAAARHAFEKRVAQRFLFENRQLVSQGKPRQAAERLAEALRLCPWCTSVHDASIATAAIIANLDSFGLKVKQTAEATPQDHKDLAVHRRLLKEASQFKTMLNDSPAIQADLERIEGRIAGFWESRIRNRLFNLSELELLRDDLALIGVSTHAQDFLETLLRLVATEGSRLVREQAHRDALLALIRTAVPAYPRSASPLLQLVASQLRSHVLGALRRELLRPDVEYSMLAFGEELLATAGDREQALRQMLARSHLARAERLAGSGRAAVLALIHLERAQQLGLTSTDADLVKVRDVAVASFAAAGPLVIQLRVETNPSDDPIVQNLARFAVIRAIRRRARPHIHIQTVSRYEKDCDIQVSIDSVNLFVPSLADLRPVSSTYLSHYEDVPNPAKRALETQLDLQRISVDYALSNLNSAISTFNINPSEWTLQIVNNARIRYSMEVDTYNLILQQYSLTPATVPRPVYLPYFFREGTVRHGWRMLGSVKVAEVEEPFLVEEVDKDLVRIGTRPDDRDVSCRRDDLFDIPVGTERLMQQLQAAADLVLDAVGKVVRGLRIAVRPDLSEPERKLVTAVLNPFVGERFRVDIDIGWAEDVIERLTLPSIAQRPVPTLMVMRPESRPRNASLKEIASFYAPVVALVLSKDGATGSGALISGDGLILTAAHVLSAEPIEVVFPRSGDTRRWPATLIFVNETHDVAVLRVTGYRSDRWFEIALTERAVAGEPVVAMGNPSIGGAEQAFGALSAGIVAKPYDPDRSDGFADLVADITVASGSSGGPLVSRRTGKIVGIVKAVVTPSVSNDFATSGYWAVAAPSSELGKWLGIRYAP
ncbi:MAG: trypsin-like peptidase domain-containing protein [Deltaproteobacteria bacterium]|nr:trypsin-like peptidase domain-containing protein [Deltaproteobacteria bacterium]